MDLKSGMAQITPSSTGALDLTQIPMAVEKAGFTAPKLYVRSKGTLAESGRGLEFRIPGQKQSFLVSQGAKLEQLKNTPKLPGRELEINGELNWRKSPPVLSVEDFVP